VHVPAARVAFSEEDRARILALVDESLRSGSLTLGPRGEAFEAAFAARHQVPYAVAVSSGTAALEIMFRALNLGGREVIVPANTFFASAASVIHAGGRPRLADVSPATLALSAESVEAALTPHTAAVLLVHIGGLITPEVDAIRRLCDERGVLLVEDAAHAHGATWNGRPAGTFGHAAAFSFYPTKVVASAEGGMIVTSDRALQDDARIYRDQGKDGFLGGSHVRLGYAWRMSEVHAAVGLVHLGRLDEFIATRRRVAGRYQEALAGASGITPLPEPPGAVSNIYKFPALLDPGIDRGEFKARLRAEHDVVCSGEVYARPLHHEPIFSTIDTAPGPAALRGAEDACARQVCLPVHSDMTNEEADYVVRAVIEVAARTVAAT
jgi:perosamine synthetase